MESENIYYEGIYCPEDDEYRVYCEICDKFCIKEYYQIHLKSQTLTNNKHQRENHFK